MDVDRTDEDDLAGGIPVNTEHVYAKADAIANQICASDAAVRYWVAKSKMEQNIGAQKLFEALKLKTNNRLGLEFSLSPEHPKVQELKQEIENLEEQLYGVPVAMQYKEAQAELNELVQGVTQLLLVRLSTALPVELGPKMGCGNSCTCGERD